MGSARALILLRAHRKRIMAVDQPAGTAEERAAAALIAAAAPLLGGKQDSPPKEFVTALFGHAVPEDLLRYEARDVAAAAEAAWSFLATASRAHQGPLLAAHCDRRRGAAHACFGSGDRQRRHAASSSTP
jgi:hypothetical protein